MERIEEIRVLEKERREKLRRMKTKLKMSIYLKHET